MKDYFLKRDLHSDELEEIITRPPSWILKRGISIIFGVITIIILLSEFIAYPEMIPISIKFNNSNAPKGIVSKVAGNLVSILVKEGKWVRKGTDIAYLESTAEHSQVVYILNRLKNIKTDEAYGLNLDNIISPNKLNLGELQINYQNLYLAYLNYKSIKTEGILQKKKEVIKNELQNINSQNTLIQETYQLQKKELELAESEYQKYTILAKKKIISPSELLQKESSLLAKRQIVPQMEQTLIGNKNSLLLKNKDLLEITNQIAEEEVKFFQSLNTFISDAENWKKQYILTASSDGFLVYGDFLQENQLVKIGDILFYINSSKQDYYGEALISQIPISRIKPLQDVLIKVRSYPHQEYGYIKGKVDYISEIPVKDSLFFLKVKLENSKQNSSIKLKPGILADGEIITDDLSILRRIWYNLTKSLRF